MNGETLPLLGHGPGISPQRLHYLDNLRATLTVTVIFHHAAVECASGYLPAALWINTNKYSLWSLFFFVSGYSSSLSLASSSSDLRFLGSRTVNLGISALLYTMVLQKIISRIIDLVWNPGWPYDRLSGPVAYVSLLLAADFIYVSIRWINRKFSNVMTHLFPTPNSREECRSNFGYSFLLLLSFIFYRCLGIHTPSPPYIIPSNDVPGFDAPLSYIIAYVVGVNFDALKEYITLNLSTAYTSLLISSIISHGSLGLAAHLSDSMSIFIHTRDQYVLPNPGLNAHTIFFALWSAFVFFSIPISLVSIFRRASWAAREWAFLARHTQAQMYINMVPVLLAVHYTGGVADVPLRIFLVGVFGVVVSWIVMWGFTAQAVINFLREIRM